MIRHQDPRTQFAFALDFAVEKDSCHAGGHRWLNQPSWAGCSGVEEAILFQKFCAFSGQKIGSHF